MKKIVHGGLLTIALFLFIGLLFLSVFHKESNEGVGEGVAKDIVADAIHSPVVVDVQKESIVQKDVSDHKDLSKKKKKPKEKEETAKKETQQKDATTEKESKKEPPKQKEKEYTEESYAGTFYVTSETLNYRSGAGTNYDVLGHLPNGTKVQVTKKTSNGWFGFEQDGKVVFASSTYLTADKPQKTEKKHASKEQKKEEKSKEKPKEEPKEEPKEKELPAEEQTIADQLTTVDGNNQLILVTTNGYNTSQAKVQAFERSDGAWKEVMHVNGFIGKNGFAANKKEGDGKSPVGKYTIGHGFGYQGNPGTKLSFKESTSNDVWVDDVNSKYYNTWQRKDIEDKDWNSAEEMTHQLYAYGFTVNYNTAQVPGEGSAIFFHGGTGHTLGCTAVDQSSIVELLQWIDPNKNPVIVQTPISEIGNY